MEQNELVREPGLVTIFLHPLVPTVNINGSTVHILYLGRDERVNIRIPFY